MHRFKTWQLFALCVGVWGTTWHAITYQLVDFPPALGVALRYAIAAACLFAICAVRGERLGRSPADHGALALQGVFMYGVSYVCVYQAERYVASGLVAVGYSASPLIAGAGAALLFGAPLRRRFVAGGVLGLLGVALMFWTEVTRPAAGDRGALGAAFTVASVLLSAVGSLAASRNAQRRIPLLPAMAWGMSYGALAAAVVWLFDGTPVVWPTSARWWLALAYLAVAGSVVTFACFLTLQDRVGAGAAGTVGVMTPLLALVVSLFLEGYRPGLLTAAGAVLAVVGNALMLRAAPARPPVVPATE